METPGSRPEPRGAAAAIITVSGLPRSGTSMMMRMLAEGGVDILTDGVRMADESNLSGYLEFEPVKRLAAGGSVEWLAQAVGRAVKIVSPLLPFLPDTFDYRVIFMRRPLDEVITSQDRMMRVTSSASSAVERPVLAAAMETHLRRMEHLLATRPCFRSIYVDYGAALSDPRATAERVGAFLDIDVDLERMAAAVDARLYRSRA